MCHLCQTSKAVETLNSWQEQLFLQLLTASKKSKPVSKLEPCTDFNMMFRTQFYED